MTLEELIKLAQSKNYCITIMCWDNDIGYQINLDQIGCGDKYDEYVCDELSLKKAMDRAKIFLDKKQLAWFNKLR